MSQNENGAGPENVAILVACSENRVIGRDGDLPWRLPDDLKRFKERTLGHTMVMGRRTYESIGRPLPGRTTIVITRQRDYTPDGVLVAGGLDQAIATADPQKTIFIAGGQEIYRMAMPYARLMYITLVHAEVDGDVYFPEWDEQAWELTEDERHDADERHAYDFSFRTYRRR